MWTSFLAAAWFVLLELDDVKFLLKLMCYYFVVQMDLYVLVTWGSFQDGRPLMYALLELYSLLLDGGDDGANKQGLELPLQYFWEWS